MWAGPGGYINNLTFQSLQWWGQSSSPDPHWTKPYKQIIHSLTHSFICSPIHLFILCLFGHSLNKQCSHVHSCISPPSIPYSQPVTTHQAAPVSLETGLLLCDNFYLLFKFSLL